MRYLLDTHTFIWMRHAPDRLGAAAREVCGDATSELVLSFASVWEMAIKISIGKLVLPAPLRSVLTEARVAQGVGSLPIGEGHLIRVCDLAFHHRDPFDRLLAAQALEEGMAVVSADPSFDAYRVTRVWA